MLHLQSRLCASCHVTQKIVTCDFTTNAKNHQLPFFCKTRKITIFAAVCKPGHKCALAHPYFHIHLFEGIQFGY